MLWMFERKPHSFTTSGFAMLSLDPMVRAMGFAKWRCLIDYRQSALG
jgi:hypothetical protein